MPRSTATNSVILPTLEQSLYSLTVDGLKWLINAIGGAGRTPLKKGDLVDMISRTLLDLMELRRIYAGLDEKEKNVVAEVVHKHNGIYKPDVMQARFPGAPVPKSYSVMQNTPYFGYGRQSARTTANSFDLFFYYGNYSSHYGWYIPADIIILLRTFTLPLAAMRMAGHKELPSFHTLHKPLPNAKEEYYVSRNEEIVFHDLAATVTLIDQGKVSVGAATGLPTLPGLRQLKEKLLVGDYFASQKYERSDDAVRTLALVALVYGANWADPGEKGSKLRLTPRGQQIIASQMGAKQVKELWDQWVKNGYIDELSRVSMIKGQKSGEVRLSKPSRRRELVVKAMRVMPPGEWVAFDDFLRFMRAENLMPKIELNQWPGLYIGSSYYGVLNDDDVNYWDIVTASYIRALVWEYAATLGLVEIAYTTPENSNHDFGDAWGLEDESYLSRYDGLLALKLTGLGEYALGITSEYKGAPGDTAEDERPPLLKVLPNLDVVVVDIHRLLPNERALLEKIATQQSTHVYRLSRDTLLEAAQNGISPQQARSFLAARNGISEDALPNTVLTFFSDLEKRLDMLRDGGKMLVLESDDPYLLTELTTTAPLKGKVQTATIGKQTVLLVPEEHEQAVRKHIKKMGYMPGRKT